MQERRDYTVLEERGVISSATVFAVHQDHWWSPRDHPYVIVDFVDSHGRGRSASVGLRGVDRPFPQTGDAKAVLYDPLDESTPVVSADQGLDARPMWILGVSAALCLIGGLVAALGPGRRAEEE
jgi:hypothetical protein